MGPPSRLTNYQREFEYARPRSLHTPASVSRPRWDYERHAKIVAAVAESMPRELVTDRESRFRPSATSAAVAANDPTHVVTAARLREAFGSRPFHHTGDEDPVRDLADYDARFGVDFDGEGVA